MKKIPHTLGNLEQKETKVTKVSFGAVLQIFVAFCFTLIWLSLVCATAFAQTTSDNVAEHEVQRRQAAMPQGEAALSRGKSAMKEKNYTLAHEEFKTAATNLPDSRRICPIQSCPEKRTTKRSMGFAKVASC